MTEPNTDNEGFILPPKIYDPINKLVRVVLPAVGTLYFALSEFWEFPYGKAVVGSIAAVAFFFGQVAHRSSENYKKAEKDVDVIVPENPFPGLDLAGKNKIVLKVDPSVRE